jgi:hypothetical protein
MEKNEIFKYFMLKNKKYHSPQEKNINGDRKKERNKKRENVDNADDLTNRHYRSPTIMI